MADIVFRSTPYGNPFIVYDSWAPWLKILWLNTLAEAGCKPQVPLWAPVYEPVHTVTGLDGIPRILNMYNFATKETASWLMHEFAADHIASIPYLGSGGPEVSTAREWWLVWKDGFAQNAGWLAEYYTQNAVNPNVTAETARASVQAEIDQARQSMPFTTLPNTIEA